MLERFLLIWLLLSSWAAYHWPAVQANQPQWLPPLGDPFVASGPLLKWLIAVTMFAIGVMLPRDEVRDVFRRWPAVLGGTALQYGSMPLLAYGLGTLGGLSGDHLIGVIMVGCVPGAMASNVLTLNARGNASYSVSLTTSATLLSPLAVPIALGLTLTSEESVDVWFLAKTSGLLLLIVVLPVVAGHCLGRRLSGRERLARRIGLTAANLAILWIIAAVVGRGREALAQLRPDLLWILLCVNLGGYAIGYLGGAALRLPESMRRALTLEIGMQNAGLGATLATQLFPDQRAVAIAPAMYTFGCMLTGAMLARAWAIASERSGAKRPATPPPGPG
jgi:BASS family bile acid:Na+ symporter